MRNRDGIGGRLGVCVCVCCYKICGNTPLVLTCEEFCGEGSGSGGISGYIGWGYLLRVSLKLRLGSCISERFFGGFDFCCIDDVFFSIVGVVASYVIAFFLPWY